MPEQTKRISDTKLIKKSRERNRRRSERDGHGSKVKEGDYYKTVRDVRNDIWLLGKTGF